MATATDRALRDLESSLALIRRYAARDLGRAGVPEAVPELARLLSSDPDPDVRIAAGRALHAIGGPEAEEALDEALSGDLPAPVRQTLVDLEEAPAEGTAPGSAELPDDPTARRRVLVERALEGTDVRWETTDYGYRLLVFLPNERKQRVRLAFDRSRPGGDPIILVVTIAGPARPDLHGWALRRNRLLRHGRLAIDEMDGHEVFVLMDAVSERAAPDELRNVILAVAADGDWVEERLTGEDAL